MENSWEKHVCPLLFYRTAMTPVFPIPGVHLSVFEAEVPVKVPVYIHVRAGGSHGRPLLICGPHLKEINCIYLSVQD